MPNSGSSHERPELDRPQAGPEPVQQPLQERPIVADFRRGEWNKSGVPIVGRSAMTDSLGIYLNEIGRVDLLTAEEERELSQAIEEGHAARQRLDEGDRAPGLRRKVSNAAAAKERFIRANLRLVVSIARRYPLPQGMDLADLVQEGNIGLEHAVDKFDWRKGFKFSTYATFWIRQAIGRALDQKASLIRIPGDRSANLRSVLRQVGGDASQLDAANAELHLMTTNISLDRPIGEDGDASFGDQVASADPSPEDLLMAMAQTSMIDQLLGRLDHRSRIAVEYRFGLHDGERHSFRDIGDRLGTTPEAARRLTKRALERLRVDATTVLAA